MTVIRVAPWPVAVIISNTLSRRRAGQRRHQAVMIRGKIDGSPGGQTGASELSLQRVGRHAHGGRRAAGLPENRRLLTRQRAPVYDPDGSAGSEDPARFFQERSRFFNRSEEHT